MAAYLIISYDVSDLDVFQQCNPGSLPVITQTMTKHGGKPLAVGGDNDWEAGHRQQVIIMEFPTKDAAHAWENDPDYAAAKALRLASTTNRFEVIAPEFVPPAS